MKTPEAYRSISEVAQLLQITPSVLRFWEKQFPQLKPMTLQRGRRCYGPDDIALIVRIQELLYKQGLTIKGAVKQLSHPQQQAVESVKEQNTGASVLNDLQGLKEYLRNYV